MARPTRRAVNRKHPVSPVRLDQVGQAPDVASAEDHDHEADQPMGEQVATEIQALLSDLPDMTEDGLESIMQECRAAIERASLEPSLSLPERGEWVSLIDDLIQSGGLEQDSGDALVRQFDEALQPLQDQQVQRALELAQRIERDGETKAREWLASQEQDEQTDRQQVVQSDRAVLPEHTSTTGSRSRRLRGPPAG